MNNPEHLQMAIEVNEVSLALGELHQEAENEKKEATKKKRLGEEQWEQQASQLECNKKAQLLPSLHATAEQLAGGSKSVVDINNKGLIELLKYFFDPPTEGLSKLKRPKLVELVEEWLQIYRASRFEA
jgi:hypothetical protein